jgi:hypothetical protein
VRGEVVVEGDRRREALAVPTGGHGGRQLGRVDEPEGA